jgi:tetratricopeptide (TPR) repeat protein
LGQLEAQASALNGVGLTYLQLGDYANALEYLLEALRIYAEEGNRYSQAVMLNNLGILHLEINDTSHALSYLTRCLQLARETGNESTQAAALDNTSNAYFQLGQYENALASAIESVRLCQELGNKSGEAEAFDSVGDAYLALGDMAQALNHFEEALHISQEIGHKHEVVEALLRIGKICQRQLQIEPALTHLHRALSLAEEIEAKRIQSQCHQALAEIHKHQIDFEHALSHYERFHTIEREVFNQETDNRLKTLEIIHQVETARRETEIYQLKNVALEQEIHDRKRAEAGMRQRTAQLEALREVGLEITAQLSLDSLLRSIVARATEMLGDVSGGLYLYRPERDVLEWAVSIGSYVAPAGLILHRGEGLAGKVWETGKPLIVDDYHSWAGRAAAWEDYPVMAVMGVPVCWGQGFLGVLNVGADASRSFSQADAELLGLFATQAAIAIRNAWLYEAAQEEIAERKRAEEQREKLIAELREALARVKTLSGLLPICAACKKIRDDQGYWHQVEVYVRDHSEADFTHGICPDCRQRLYPELYPEKG